MLEMLRNFRKPLTLYKYMKKWYISQAFSIFSTRYKKWSIHILMYQDIIYIFCIIIQFITSYI